MLFQNKVAIIGWDSASFDIITPLLESGHLPNLQSLIDRGQAGILRSTIQPITPTAWSSFITGVNPGKHGIFDFVRLDKSGQFQVNSGANIGFPTIWSRLSAKRKKVVVANVPMTYPPLPVNGELVSGMDSPDQCRAYTYPAELAARIMQQFPNYRVGVKTNSLHNVDPESFLEKYIEDLIDMTAMRADLSVQLLEQSQPDFFMTVFIAPDRIQHAMGSSMAKPITPEDGIGRIYKACDDALGKVLHQLGDKWTIIVASDHGACAYHRVFELSTWLQQKGWMHLQPPKWYTPILEFTQKINRNVRRRLNLPVQQRAGLQQFQDRIVWPQTQAFSVGAFGNIYINRKDRFPWGIVSEEEYATVCNNIIAQLIQIQYPQTKKPVVKAVHHAQEIYDGDYKQYAPDLLIETHQDYFVRNNLDQEEGKLFYPAGIYKGRQLAHTGRHTLDGLVVAAGPLISASDVQVKANIIDVAPTVMYLMDTAIPQEMDGQLHLNWINPDYINQYPPHYDDTESGKYQQDVSAYSNEESDLVADHLRALGYLD